MTSRPILDRWRRNPSLFQVNAITWLGRLRRELGRPVSLAEVPDEELDWLASRGFDLVWVMAVWQRGPASVEIALDNPHVPPQLSEALPDWTPEDVVGSPFAVHSYVVDASLGGDEALAELRRRLAERGIGLVLDFVPNHIARDHPWVFHRPELLVTRDPDHADRDPDRYFRAETAHGPRAVGFGKDPHFVGWIDTAQLNYRHPELRAEMTRTVADIATRCDGVRCDMAMLVFDDVFVNTWPETVAWHPEPPNVAFWPQAIDAARAVHPTFLFIAEVYWSMEGRMLENGFDYAYDKAFYDHLRSGDVASIQQAARSSASYLRRTVHFVENHDEDPAVTAFGPRTAWAATISATLPGLRFFHEGQFDGRTRRLPVQLGRPNPGDVDPRLIEAYDNILNVVSLPELREGRFSIVDVEPLAAAGDDDDDTFWNVLAYRWDLSDTRSAVAIVANLSGGPARARVRLPLLPVAGRSVDVVDLIDGDRRSIHGDDLTRDGLELSLSPHHVIVLRVDPHAASA